MKTCSKCLKEKDNNKFDFQRNQCHDCRNEQKRLRPKKKYDISVAEKYCIECKIIKSANNFHKNTSISDGLEKYCKSCRSEKTRNHYLKNIEALKQKSLAHYAKVKNTEKFKQSKRDLQKRKLKEDPKYLLTRRLRNRLYYALKKKSWKKDTKFNEYIGCDLEQLRSHIELQFQPGMSWDNQGEWHIDHIVPLDSAETEEQLYKLCHYTNLQPLWAVDNIKKANKT